MKCVVLMSGGMFSYVAAKMLWSQKVELYGLTVAYGQTNSQEIAFAIQQCRGLGIQHETVGVAFPLKRYNVLGYSRVPQHRPNRVQPVSPMSLPGRTVVFLGLAYEWAVGIGAQKIVLGATTEHSAGYPELRPEYLKTVAPAFHGVDILCPLLGLRRLHAVKRGAELGVDYKLTRSCLMGGQNPCGLCEGCVNRMEAFRAAGVEEQ